MKAPLGPILTFDELPSTQDKAAELLKSGENVGVVFARHQSKGRGRFDRSWHSQPGESMTASFVFDQYADHPAPWLVGMTMALVVAGAFRTQVQWPNDIVLNKRKMGGILTELHRKPNGSLVPVIGVGLNLNQPKFPEDIEETATSLFRERDILTDPEQAVNLILETCAGAPEPDSWADLEPAWMLFDDTPGKTYKLPDGDPAVALGLGPDGQLVCSVHGETQSVLVADALFR